MNPALRFQPEVDATITTPPTQSARARPQHPRLLAPQQLGLVLFGRSVLSLADDNEAVCLP